MIILFGTAQNRLEVRRRFALETKHGNDGYELHRFCVEVVKGEQNPNPRERKKNMSKPITSREFRATKRFRAAVGERRAREVLEQVNAGTSPQPTEKEQHRLTKKELLAHFRPDIRKEVERYPKENIDALVAEVEAIQAPYDRVLGEYEAEVEAAAKTVTPVLLGLAQKGLDDKRWELRRSLCHEIDSVWWRWLTRPEFREMRDTGFGSLPWCRELQQKIYAALVEPVERRT